MPAPDEEAKRLRSIGPRRRQLVPEAPLERLPPEGGLAPAFQDPGNCTFDDGIGEAPTSQFVGDLQTPGATPEKQVFGAPLGERSVVDVAAIAEPAERLGDGIRIDPATTQMRRDLGFRARCAGEKRDGRRERPVRGIQRRRSVRSGRS